MAQRNWKVGNKVIIDQVSLKGATYTDLTGSIIEVKKSSSEIGIAVEGISDRDIEMNELEKREGKSILWFGFDDRTVHPS
ncbi:hypothetical protein ES703_108712 [subsurface metagenome]